MEVIGKEICIVAGGPEQLMPDFTAKIDQDIYWIGVDRGVFYLLDRGITPNRAVGDFDSISEDEIEKFKSIQSEINQFFPEKDETDMELALLWSCNQSPTKVTIYGATGGRLDHFLVNAHMLSVFQQKASCRIEIVDLQNKLGVYLPGQYNVSMDESKPYISFLPLSSNVKNLTLQGFKYPLLNRFVEFGSSLCISNELNQEIGTFSFDDGILMMVRSTD